jgi:hypothetical protein
VNRSGAGRLPFQVKPYAISEPVGRALLTSERRYRRIKWRHTTRAALEHPQNQHEYQRAKRAGALHAAILVALALPFTLTHVWAAFSWDALKATVAAWGELPTKAHGVVEGTFTITAALAMVTLATDGWGLVQAIEACVAYVVLTFPLVFAVVMRDEISWCADPHERKALEARHKQQETDGAEGQTTPVLVLGETASPPGLTRAQMRGGHHA